MNDNISPYTQCASATRDKMRMYGPPQYHEVADVSSGDYPLADQRCRYIECDYTGTFKVDYNDDFGHPRTLTGVITAGEKKLIANVTKVYRYRTGSTAITATTYKDDGSAAVIGLRIYY